MSPRKPRRIGIAPARITQLTGLVRQRKQMRQIGGEMCVSVSRVGQLLRRVGLLPLYKEVQRMRVRDQRLLRLHNAHPERARFLIAVRRRNFELLSSRSYHVWVDAVPAVFHRLTTPRKVGRTLCYRTKTVVKNVLHVFLFPSGRFLVMPPHYPRRAGDEALIRAVDEPDGKDMALLPDRVTLRRIRRRYENFNGQSALPIL